MVDLRRLHRGRGERGGELGGGLGRVAGHQRSGDGHQRLGRHLGNELWDSSGTAQRLAYGAITGGSKTVNAGDTCTIASGALSISVTGH